MYLASTGFTNIVSQTGTTAPVVEKNSFLTLHYRLALGAENRETGADLINTFKDKPATLSLGTGALAPALEACLLGLPEGTHTTFELAAGLAFGEHQPELVQWVAHKLLLTLQAPEEGYRLGDVVQFPTPDGNGHYAGTVRQINASNQAAQFDFNHPLAGQCVTFEVHVIGVL